MPSKLPVNSPLREYVYDILYSLPSEDRFKLQGKYYNIGRTNSRAKHFCNTASVEELQHVLTLLGIEWYMVFSPKSFVGGTQKMLDEIVEDDNVLGTLRNIIKRKIFVTGSKQYATLLATITQSANTNIYIKNLQLGKVGYHHRKWTKGITSGATKEANENVAAVQYLTRTIHNSMTAFKTAKFSECDLILLLYLYSLQHAFVDYEKMVESLSGVINPRRMFAAIRRLKQIRTIEKHPKKKAYTITTTGVLEINKIIERVLLLNEVPW